MSTLLSASPSSGFSEVLTTLRNYEPLGRRTITLKRLARLISRTWDADDEEGGDSSFETDLLTVAQALADAGHVTPRPSALTDGIKLTSSGRVFARHPRPRARHL